MATASMLFLCTISVLLIFVILIQRGRGGGLVGAFGGMGGMSAFGNRPGDVFTQITVALITVWVLSAGVTGILIRKESQKFQQEEVSVETKADKNDAQKPLESSADDSKAPVENTK